jgi:hypothetical protein
MPLADELAREVDEAKGATVPQPGFVRHVDEP